MLEMLFDYTIGILLASMVPLIVFYNIVRFMQWIRCFKVKVCSREGCLFEICCCKYEEICAEERLEKLSFLIEECRKSYE